MPIHRTLELPIITDRDSAEIDDVVTIQRLELMSGDVSLGTHPVQMYGTDEGFVLTAFTRPQPTCRQHLEVLLKHAPSLIGIQWINLNYSRLEVTTIESETGRRMGAEE
jgi:hypothetical protein